VTAFFAGLVLIRERKPSRKGPRQSSEAIRLARERDRHLADLVALDDRQALGEGSEAEYRRERERLLTKASALQELLDEMTRRDA
jgi:hypothetical protein